MNGCLGRIGGTHAGLGRFLAGLCAAAAALALAPRLCADDVVLRSGVTLSGTAAEDGLFVEVSDGAVRRRIPASEVVRIEWKRPESWLARPPDWPDETAAIGDLDVLCIEILPRTGIRAGRDRWRESDERPSPSPPEPLRRPGDRISFVAHLANRGTADMHDVRLSFRVDGEAAFEGVVPFLAAGRRMTFSVQRAFDPSMAEVSFEAWSPAGRENREISFANNLLRVEVRAVGVLAAAEKEVWDSFAASRNMAGSFSFEDFVQYHAAQANAILASPAGDRPGAASRIRIDGFAVCGREEALRMAAAPGPGAAGYSGVVVVDGPVRKAGTGALGVRWDLVRRMAGCLGLCAVRPYSGGAALQAGFMDSEGAAPLSELEALALARFGAFGAQAATDFLLCVPSTLRIAVTGPDGDPAAKARVISVLEDGSEETVFEAACGRGGVLAMSAAGLPRLSGVSGVSAPRDVFGAIALRGGGFLVVEAEFADGSVDRGVLGLPDLNLAFLRGAEAEAEIAVRANRRE